MNFEKPSQQPTQPENNLAEKEVEVKNETPEQRQQRLTEAAERLLEKIEKRYLDQGRFSYYQFTGDEKRLEAEGGKGAYEDARLLKASPSRKIIKFSTEAVEAHKEPEKPIEYLEAWDRYVGKLPLGKEIPRDDINLSRARIGGSPVRDLSQELKEEVLFRDLPKEVAYKLALRTHSGLAGGNEAVEYFIDAKLNLIGFVSAALEKKDADTVIEGYKRMREFSIKETSPSGLKKGIAHTLEARGVSEEEQIREFNTLIDSIKNRVAELDKDEDKTSQDFVNKLKESIPELT